MFDVGSGELMLILVVALLLFGGRLPEVARNLGRSVGEIKRGLTDSTSPLRDAGREVKREVEGAIEEGEKVRRAADVPTPPSR